MDNTRKADLVEEAASINIVIRRVQEKLDLSRTEAKDLVELAILSEIGGKLTDVVEYLAPLNEGLIDRGRIRDIKIIPARAVEFGINAVEREGHLSVDISAKCILGPGGVDLA